VESTEPKDVLGLGGEGGDGLSGCGASRANKESYLLQSVKVLLTLIASSIYAFCPILIKDRLKALK
jgi:hypothetical protein